MAEKRQLLPRANRDVWCCWACLKWFPRSEPSLKNFGYGDSADAPCPSCGEYQLILYQRGWPKDRSNP